MSDQKLDTVEFWLPVDGFEDYYEVSNYGRVRSVLRRDTRGFVWQPKMIALNPDPRGYISVMLYRGSKHTKRWVHRLVLEAFKGPANGLIACHWDGNPSNNHESNLRWGTGVDNSADAIRHGTQHNPEMFLG